MIIILTRIFVLSLFITSCIKESELAISIEEEAGGSASTFTEVVITRYQLPDVGTCSASNQNNVTNSSTLDFLLTFDKQIDETTLTTSDIFNQGTASGPISWSLQNCGDNLHFLLSTTSISGEGTIVPGLIVSSVKYKDGTAVQKINNSNSEIEVDTTSPSLVTVSNVPSNGTYAVGASLDFAIQWDEPVVVTGVPSVQLVLDSGIVDAQYVSGSDSQTLIFRKIIVNGESDIDGISMVPSISLSGGSIADNAGNAASLNFSLPDLSAVFVDAVAPSISSIPAPTSKVYINGENLLIQVNFDEPVNVTGSPRIEMQLDSGLAYANYLSGSGTNTLTFQKTVFNGELDSNGIVLNSPLQLNGGTILDIAGNAVSLAFSPPATSGVLIDGVIPSISFVTLPVDKTYKENDLISFDVKFSEQVIVTGLPRIQINTDLNTVYATYSSGTGTDILTFTKNVMVNETDADGIELVSLIQLNGGTIVDNNDNNALLSFAAGVTSGILLDGTRPSVTIEQHQGGVIGSCADPGVQADPTDNMINFLVDFSEPIKATTFTVSDINNVGAGGASTLNWSITACNSQRYLLSTTMIEGEGTIIPKIAVGTVEDIAGNINTASSSVDNSVTFDVVADRIVIVDPTDDMTTNTVTVKLRALNSNGYLDSDFSGTVELLTTGSATGGGVVGFINGLGQAYVNNTIAETTWLSLSNPMPTLPNVASSQDLVFSAGPASMYQILNPTDGTVDDPINVSIIATDEFGNRNYTYSNYVDLLTSSGTTAGEGTVSIINGAGSVAISNTVSESVLLTLDNPLDSGMSINTTQDVYFEFGAPSQFIIFDPLDDTVGAPVSVAVIAADQFGNQVLSYQNDVSLLTTGSAIGGGIVDIVNGWGILDISNTVSETIDLYLLDSQGTSLDISSSQDLVFSPGMAISYNIINPTDSFINTPSMVVVEVHDSFGNVVTDFNTDVDLGSNSGTVTGLGTIDIVNGTGSINIQDSVSETAMLGLDDSMGTGLDVSSVQDIYFAP